MDEQSISGRAPVRDLVGSADRLIKARLIELAERYERLISRPTQPAKSFLANQPAEPKAHPTLENVRGK
ncbi:hypothetical protein [Bradyrhizobium cytisi]|uniref:Uncharacterized protein n=1 Tax=Bradyrhizobium cytisi TaxID=515489 RepID=A0A5S4VYU8_9BRAD|nr:hypothetical protein [Bradyrhizobium cytisi]TYL73906.1 hypothetical protein FXB38_35855 [Bradyrhizobium cytisi]